MGIRYRPWSILVVLHFGDESTARRFERYLKSGSGRAFARRHFAPAEPETQKRGSDD